MLLNPESHNTCLGVPLKKTHMNSNEHFLLAQGNNRTNNTPARVNICYVPH